MPQLKLADLPEEKRTRRWILSEIRYQEDRGIQTRCACNHCGNSSRGGCCADCWRSVLKELHESETSSTNKR